MLKVCLAPAGMRPFLADAIRDGGAEVVGVDAIGEAEALLWASPSGAADLRALLDLHDNIRWVQLPWAGIEPFVDVLDDKHLWTAGQGVYSEPVAEHALTLALAGLRDMKTRAHATSWQKPSGLSLFDASVVVVGAGGITRALLPLLAPFRCKVSIVRRRSHADVVPGATRARTFSFDERRAAFKDADVVILACALTRETRGMIGAAELASMKRTAWLINVARGGLVDTQALVDALAAGVVGGAALDVTEPEPLPEGHPLWTSPRCIITPHVGNTPEMAVPLLSERVRENVRRYIAHKPMLGVVDVVAGY